jgi:hypothetical protein
MPQHQPTTILDYDVRSCPGAGYLGWSCGNYEDELIDQHDPIPRHLEKV